ncbi:alpha/beta hydrolase [Deinococcus cavernae]|uniref:Alpha/beta hydrolase n=1 Tax=Deinococcus cavernae TaxID=2320857 RepID=A0A418V049_9DEIO|nr:alpha/beta hydrolase [Deinococcus cavernae]RJF69097.1 alpha/beta hydrolase [Deinococcus cavernae]
MKLKKIVLGTLVLTAAALLLNACAPATQSSAAQSQGVPLAGQTMLRPAVNGERRSLSLPGFGQVNYYASPSGTGRPLVLTHSINAAGSAYEMKPLWDAYVGTRPVYALEWPGFGRSERPDVTYTPELMTRALTALVAELNTDVDVVSLSLGSEFAARAALSEPRIKTLALISPSGMGEARGGTQRASDADRGVRLYNTLNSFGNTLYAALRTRPSIEYFLSRSFRGPVDQGLIDYAIDTTRQPGAKYAPLYFVSGRLFTPDAYGDLYRPLSTPTLVLYDRDGFVSFSRLPLFAQQPNARVVRIPDTDGLPHFEKPAEVKAALDAFWAATK